MNKKALNLLFVTLLLIVCILKWGLYFFATLLAISFLIFFHELGHFLIAKFFGVKVNVFSIGFGEKIFIKHFKGTDYAISAIPLGGYVSLKGQDDFDPSKESSDKDSYNTLNPAKKIAILLAGPLFNIILAFFLFIALGYVGVDKLAPIVGGTIKNSPAFNIGLKKNDEILEINGKKILIWDEISKNVGLKPLNLKIKRDNKIINLELTPKILDKKSIFGEDIKVPMIGIAPLGKFIRIYHKGFDSLKFALNQTIDASILIYKSLYKLIEGAINVKDMGGIVAMADITSMAAKIGLSAFIYLVALISVNLGVMNLLPIPALDGGHIFFNLFELIFRRPVPKKVFIYASYCGIFLLIGLSIFMAINDILRMSGFYR